MTHAPFRSRRHHHPVRDRFVREGSAPLALAPVVTVDCRFGRAVDNNDDSLPSQSVSNIDRIMTSSLCLSSLLVSVIFVVVLLLLKCPSQSRWRRTSKKLRAYPPLTCRCHHHPPLRRCCHRRPPNEQCADVDPRHRRRRGHRTSLPPCRGAVVATIERRKIPSARRRRESSRRRRGLAPNIINT